VRIARHRAAEVGHAVGIAADSFVAADKAKAKGKPRSKAK
jgi:hypothetical protein